MKITCTAIPDGLIDGQKLFSDERGFFLESVDKSGLSDTTGLDASLVRSNNRCSADGCLRGEHYRLQQLQDNLTRVDRGSVFDGAVTFAAGRRLWAIGRERICHKRTTNNSGSAHSFHAMHTSANFLYKTTEHCAPIRGGWNRWADAPLGIAWPELSHEPALSSEDSSAGSFLAMNMVS